MSTAILKEALELEAKEVMMNLEEMMGEFLANAEEQGEFVRPELDELTIRRMFLARQYLLKDIDKMSEMKRAIVAEWDQRIQRKKEQVKSIEQVLQYYVKEKRNGQALQFDVGTISLRKVPARVEIKDELKARQYLKEQGQLDAFLKPAELDKTLLKNYMLDQLKKKAEEETQKQVQQLQADGVKVTKKKEKEIYDQIWLSMSQQLRELLPEGFEYVEPGTTVSIRSNME